MFRLFQYFFWSQVVIFQMKQILPTGNHIHANQVRTFLSFTLWKLWLCLEITSETREIQTLTNWLAFHPRVPRKKQLWNFLQKCGAFLLQKGHIECCEEQLKVWKNNLKKEIFYTITFSSFILGFSNPCIVF